MLQGYAWEPGADISHDIKLTLFSSLLVSWCGLTFNSFRQHGKFPKPWKVAQNQTALITAGVLIVCRSWLSNFYRNSVGHIQTLVPLLTCSVAQSPFWEPNRFSASQEIPPHFMEPEGSLPHSQVPATCPYPEPARSSPYVPFPLLRSYQSISPGPRLSL